jgi:hypothetical protein
MNYIFCYFRCLNPSNDILRHVFFFSDPVLIHVDENNEPALVSQVAVSRFNPAKLASCAPDKHLTTLDISSGLNTSSVTRRVDMADSIASVAWDTHNGKLSRNACPASMMAAMLFSVLTLTTPCICVIYH